MALWYSQLLIKRRFAMFLHKDFMPYVVALYRQAVEEDVLKHITAAAKAIAKALLESPDLLSFLKISFIPFEEKITILETLTPSKTPPLFLGFLTLLGQNRKLSSLEPILNKFIEYANHKSGVKHIRITSAFALDTATKKALQAALESQTKQSVELSITIDPTLIGGIIIHYNHHELDLSLKNAIFSLKSTLKELYS
ncbi:ATP synthase subunit delta [Candidatus Bodocaedibacter vickermanii]|uniref:ATP synthase subunit delta n=2 Tax=Candidatus Bodocaedibacter vickermanii TaxID=2741701 RepID=A0A7L9RV26_9PROT|nr:ATP synthase subunit delta [Candidatus Paracaedibacteraceae bacterium 'Lake Konstanz']